jgi:serine/threonine-protein kinase
VLHELGRGGMGVVYLVEHTDRELPRRAALKRMRTGAELTARGRDRFRAERRLLARLEHPGIARLVDGGVDDSGTPWFAMEYVDGVPVDAWCRERQLGVPDRVRLMLRVCDAVQHAHTRLVVHRDLKPSNVFVDRDGIPRLLDFGIAKLLDDDTDGLTLTRAGGAPMSLPYAAPEQLRDEPVSTATDVYALGVLLHVLLTGALPFGDGRDGRAALEFRILAGTTTRPSQRVREEHAAATGVPAETLVRALRNDLDVIVQRAMHPEPARRYPSADALADDLRAWLDQRPIAARPDSAAYRLRLLTTRHPVATVAITLSFCALVAFSVLTARQAQRLAVARENAEAVADFLGQTLAANDLHIRRPGPPSLREVLDAGAMRAESTLVARPEVRGALLTAIAPAYHALGEWDRERALLLQADRALQDAFGRNSRDRISVLLQLGTLEMYVGTPEAAETHFRDILRLLGRATQYGNVSADHVRTLLGTALLRQGRELAIDSLGFPLPR